MKKTLCVISMSGGLDSTTLAFKALNAGFDILPVNINYGQKNIVEMRAFQNIIDFIKATPFKNQLLDPIILDMDTFLGPINEKWKQARDNGTIKAKTDMEFYTPSRNLIFSAIASVIGEIFAIDTYKEIKIGIGIHKHQTYDRDYWDIKPQFAKAFDAVLSLNDCMDIEIYAPYVKKFKNEIVWDCLNMGVPWEKTWTCYNPVIKDNKAFPCLKCEACKERQLAGEKADFTDINNYFVTL